MAGGDDELTPVNVVVLGAQQSGKSTMVGHMILGSQPPDDDKKPQRLSFMKTMLEQEAQNAPNRFIGVMGHIRKESEAAGKVAESDMAQRHFFSSRCNFRIVDAPGHKNFIQNVISGASRADVALLVLDAVHGAFEVGMATNGLTREHAEMAFALGVKRLVVAVTKMDEPGVAYSHQRYEEIVAETARHLERVGFTPARVPFVPISGLEGFNLATSSDKMSWYEGPTLLEALGNLGSLPHPSLARRPLRVVIEEVYTVGDVGKVAIGSVETGTLQCGQRVAIAPGDLNTEVLSVEVQYEAVQEASAGSRVSFSVGASGQGLRKGMVLSDALDDAARDCESFLAQVVMLNFAAAKILSGCQLWVDCHAAHVPCVLEEVSVRMDRRTGRTVEKNPAALCCEDAAFVRLRPLEPLCIESFNSYAGLGRFAMSDGNTTLAVGVIKEVLKRRPPPVSVAS